MCAFITGNYIYVYGTFFKPYISQHENEIDRNLLELRARATDMVVLYFQKGASVLGQNTFFDVLKYVAAQPPSHKSQSGVDQMHYYSFFVKSFH
jgi:receptor expression-enhancing protein 1/2/3/4